MVVRDFVVPKPKREWQAITCYSDPTVDMSCVQVAERAAFRKFMAAFCILQFVFAFSIWAFYSNLFALFAGKQR